MAVDNGASGVTDVTAVVLAYGDEPWLRPCVDALLASRGVDVDVVLVDNGCTEAAVLTEVASRPRVTLVSPGVNLGYAGGCNSGAEHARGHVIAFVNSDAVVEPAALAALAAAAAEPDVGLATGSIRLGHDPALLNTAGNPVHLVGLSWSGHFGEPASRWDARRPVASVSGAAFAVRREVWQELGGFDATWFAYNEDAELSLRAWQRGRQVVFVPEAVVVHHYEFSRHPDKSYLLERNRLLNVLTLYQLRTLVLLAPVLLAFEVAMLAVAARQGWLRQKVAGYAWIIGHIGWLMGRRRHVQSARLRSDRDLAWLLTARLEPANVPLPPGAPVVNAITTGYWRLASRLL